MAACCLLTSCGDTEPVASPAPRPRTVGDVPEIGPGTAGPLADLLGLPAPEFTDGAIERGFGPIRVAWRDGEMLDGTDDVVPGRVRIAIESRSGTEIVVDARVEAGDGSEAGHGPLDPSTVKTEVTLAPAEEVAPSIVSVTDDVAFYPACGNETLELPETSWYVVGQIGYRPFQENLVRLVEQIEAAPRELPATPPSGIVRVAPPGPGDDIGTLVVWSDGVARWTSERGTIDVWMIDEPIERNWDC